MLTPRLKQPNATQTSENNRRGVIFAKPISERGRTPPAKHQRVKPVPIRNKRPRVHGGPGPRGDVVEPAADPTQAIQTEYATYGCAWWDRCTRHERAYWCAQAQSDRPIDAWQAFQHALKAQPPATRATTTPCPECAHTPTTTIDFPDGRVVFSPECGHRALECYPAPETQG